jgi:hypothetical protein
MERWKGRARIAPMLTDMLLSSELAREKMWSRIHLIPVLQAEEDRDLVRRHWAEQAREKELLGAETKVYNNDRCVGKFSELRLRDRKRAKYTDIGADSCVLHTQSHPARPRSRSRRVGPEIRIRGQRKSCCTYCGLWGVFHIGNYRPMTVSNVHSHIDIQVTCGRSLRMSELTYSATSEWRVQLFLFPQLRILA